MSNELCQRIRHQILNPSNKAPCAKKIIALKLLFKILQRPPPRVVPIAAEGPPPQPPQELPS